MGRRIEKNVDGSITKFLWDENILLAELDASNNINKLYTYNPQTSEPISMSEGADTYYYLNDHLITPQKMVDSSGAVVWSAEYKAFGEVIITVNNIGNNLRFPGQYFDEENGLHYNYYRYYDHSTGRYNTPDPINLGSTQLHSQVNVNGFSNYYIENITNYLPCLKCIIQASSAETYSKILKTFLIDPQTQNLYIYGLNNPVVMTDILGTRVSHYLCFRLYFGETFLCFRIEVCPSKVAPLGLYTIRNVTCILICYFTPDEWLRYQGGT